MTPFGVNLIALLMRFVRICRILKSSELIRNVDVCDIIGGRSIVLEFDFDLS